MKKFRKALITGAIVLTFAVTSITAFAVSNYDTPAEAVAGLTGETVESVIAKRSETGKTYGTMANDAGKLAEFKAEMLEMKKDALAKRVASGAMTQERADQIIAAMEQNMANCDGTGAAKMGQRMSAGFGGMNKTRQGGGLGQGAMGRGQGTCAGSCQAQ